MYNIPTWFIPSFYGDVRLKRDAGGCVVLVQDLTEAERVGLVAFMAKAQAKGWIDTGLDLAVNGEHHVQGPIDQVGKALARCLKQRQLVDLVLFDDGKVKDVSDDAAEAAKNTADTAAPKAAATVALPTQGCPAPDFAQADVRATEVLLSFLTPQQATDWKGHGSFITTGSSGLRYAVTSRHAVSKLRGQPGKPGFERSFYCLDEGRAYCVHDWAVPAAEEVLGLHLLAQTVHGERYLRHLE
jgi:hypothetical protein